MSDPSLSLDGGVGTAFEFPLGGEGPDPTAPALVTNVLTALARLIEQYRSATLQPNIQALVGVFAAETQVLTDAASSLATITSIDDSQGVQLDNIGAIVGEPRQGFDDVPYRLHLKARVLLNRSSGTIPEILALFELLLGDAVTLTLTEGYPAGFTLAVGGMPVDDTLAGYLWAFLQEAKDAGVRAILEWSPDDDSSTFCFAGGNGLGFEAGVWASAK